MGAAQSKRLVFNRKITSEAGSWSEIFHRPVYLHVAGAIIREHIDTALYSRLEKMSTRLIHALSSYAERFLHKSSYN
jgi:hypothetical protein